MGPKPLTTLDSLESVKPRSGFGRNRACAMTYSIVWLAVERQSLLREDLFCNIECKYVEICESYMCSMLSRQIYLKMVDNERMRSGFHLVWLLPPAPVATTQSLPPRANLCSIQDTVAALYRPGNRCANVATNLAPNKGAWTGSPSISGIQLLRDY